MRYLVWMKGGLALMLLALTTACVTPQPYDYTEFKKSKPKSILVMPPLNNSPEVKATHAVYSQLSYPLGEAGYYVFPVAMVEETFRQNGVANAAEAQDVPLAKLRQVFGPDAVLYVTISDYGSQYQVFQSVTRVSLQAKLVDAKTGVLLWNGAATVVHNPSNNSGGGLIGMMVSAAINQIVNDLSEVSYGVAGQASNLMLNTNPSNGILPGPRYPIKTEGVAAK